MAVLNFNAQTVAPAMGMETVPKGWYNVIMDQSEMKPTKDGQGGYLECRFTILDGAHAGKHIFTRLNLQNKNQTTVEIAQKQLSAIAHAVQVLQVQDSQQLHGRPLKVKVKIRVDTTGEYEDQNEITVFKDINSVVEQGGDSSPAMPAAFANMGQPQGFGGQPPAQPAAWAPQAAQQQPVQQQQPPQQQPGGQPWGQGAAQPWQQPQGQFAPAQQAPVQQQQPQFQPQQQPQQFAQPQQPVQQQPQQFQPTPAFQPAATQQAPAAQGWTPPAQGAPAQGGPQTAMPPWAQRPAGQ